MIKKGISIVMTFVLLLLIFSPSINVKAEQDMRLDIPFYRQIWEPWGKQYTGFSNDQIEMTGCALTSFAMLLKYYGVDTDPGRLNDWLKTNGGYQGSSSIIWSKVSELTDWKVNYGGIINYDNGANLDYINSLLDSGFPIMARVNYLGTNHYILISGRSGDKYYINDPWYENPARTLNESYEPYNNPAASIKGIVVFTTDYPTPQKVPVRKVASIFSEGQMSLVHPLKTPTITLEINNPYFTVNNTKKEIDPGRGTAPILYKDRTLLPIRAVMEQMSGKVTWDDADQKVTIDIQGRTVEVWVGCKTFFINGWEFAFDAEPIVINGRVYLPLRIIVEKLTGKLTWDEKTQRVIISER